VRAKGEILVTDILAWGKDIRGYPPCLINNIDIYYLYGRNMGEDHENYT
jgi:hypothetical protein